MENALQVLWDQLSQVSINKFHKKSLFENWGEHFEYALRQTKVYQLFLMKII